MEMIIREPLEKSSVVVHLVGDCDLYSAPRLKVELLKKIEAGVRRILIDMADLRYLDSSGVGVIICLLQAAKRVGSEIHFKDLTGGPRRVLERTNLLPIISEVYTRPDVLVQASMI
jgi:anti-sigma B factor antagonist